MKLWFKTAIFISILLHIILFLEMTFYFFFLADSDICHDIPFVYILL